MPPKKNPFMLFVDKRRKEYEKENNTKLSLPQAVTYFGPEWSIRSDNHFKSSQLRLENGPMEKSEQDRSHYMKRFELSRIIGVEPGDPTNYEFVVAQCSYYAILDDKRTFIPAEIGIGVFSLDKGLRQNFCTLIDPGDPPLGYANDFKVNRKKLGIPAPPFEQKSRDYGEIWSQLSFFLKRHQTPWTKTTYLFCHPNEMETVQGCLDWIAEKAGAVNNWEVYSFSSLIFLFAKLGRSVFINWVRHHRDMIHTHALMNATASSGILGSTPVTLQNESSSYRESEKQVGPILGHRVTWAPIFHHIGDLTDDDIDNMDLSEPPWSIVNGPPKARRIPKSSSDSFAQVLQNIKFDAQGADKSNESNTQRQATPSTYTAHLAQHKDKEMFIHESQAEEFLNSLDLASLPELACPHHMANHDGIFHCPLSMVNRFIFNSIEILIPFFHILPIEGTHFPFSDPEMEGQKRMFQVMYYTHCTYENLPGFEDSTFRRKKKFGRTTSMSSLGSSRSTCTATISDDDSRATTPTSY